MRHRGLRRIGAALTGILLMVALVPIVHAQEGPSITVISPADGDTVTSSDISLELQHSGFDNSCKFVGLPDADGQGHVHVMIDGMSMAVLTNFYCGTDTISFSGAGLEPGEHTIIVDVATNTHLDLMDTAQEFTIDYQPSNPEPLPQAAESGTPTAHILSPADGATLGPTFDLQLSADDFNPSCDLEGKANVPGYGHYHVFVDMPMMDTSESMDMMSMQGMVAMPCDSLPVDLSAWPSGQHTLVVELVQNDHTPLEGAQLAEINFTLDNPDLPVAQVVPNTGQSGVDAGYAPPLLAAAASVALAFVAGGFALRRRFSHHG